MDEEQKIYLETLKELNTRSISTRRITITFIYILLLATALVLTGIFAIKSKNNGNDSNLLIVFYVQIMPDDLVMQLHRF